MNQADTGPPRSAESMHGTVREYAVGHSQQGEPQPGEGTADILDGGDGGGEQGAGRERWGQGGKHRWKRKDNMRWARSDWEEATAAVEATFNSRMGSGPALDMAALAPPA